MTEKNFDDFQYKHLSDGVLSRILQKSNHGNKTNPPHIQIVASGN